MTQTQQAEHIASQHTQSQQRKFWMRWRVRLGYPSGHHLLVARHAHMALNCIRNGRRRIGPDGSCRGRRLSAQRPRTRRHWPIRAHAQSALFRQRDSGSRIRRRLSFLDRRFIGELVLRNFLLRRNAQRRRRSAHALWRGFRCLRHPCATYSFQISLRAAALNLRRSRRRTVKLTVDFPGRNIAAIANIELCSAPLAQWQWCACECTFARASDIERQANQILIAKRMSREKLP